MNIELRPLSKAEKRERWKAYQGTRADKLEEVAGRCKEPHKKELGNFLMLEFEGGACPMCGKMWREVTFENQLGYCHYFLPDCDCYAHCPECNTYLYEEHVSQYLRDENWCCPRCGWRLLVGVEKRWGAEYKRVAFFSDRQDWQREIREKREEAKKKRRDNRETL